MTLDAAISEAVLHIIPRLDEGAKVALVPFDAPTGRLSEYIFEELWGYFEDSQRFIMVDRINLDRIDTEIRHQLESGRVDDDLVVSITGQYGAEVLIFGQMRILGQSPAGPEYRMTIYATDIERAASNQRAFIIRPDMRLASLLNVPLEEEVDRALAIMARAVDQRTTIAVGRISHAGTQTVTSLSAWLKNSIISGAQKQRDIFQVASESESADFAVASRSFTLEAPVSHSPVQAIITGNFSPLDNDADVSLQLVSTGGNRTVLATARFVIPAAELERRRLSLFPERDQTVISRAEFHERQQVVDPYAGRNNSWTFTVTPNVLDGIYHDGDFMYMQVFSQRDAYFRLIHVDVHGNTQIIYPHSPQDNNFIHAGQTRQIPDNTRFRMGPPFGEEMILASAYDQPFILPRQSGSVPLNAETITRGLTVESSANTVINPSATAKFNYIILPR